MRRANTILKEFIDKGAITQAVAEWVTGCVHLKPVEQLLPLILLIFQDNLLEIAVGFNPKKIGKTVQFEFIRGDLAIKFSSKADSNRPFTTTFGFIGAEFDRADRKRIE